MKKILLSFLLLIIVTLTFGQTLKKYRELPLVPTGVTYTLPLASYNDYFLITGTQTLTNNNTITYSGTPVKGMTLEFWQYSTATYLGGSLIVMGRLLTQYQAANTGLIRAIYDGSAWQVYYFHNFLTVGVIDSVYLNTDVYGNGITKQNGISMDIDSSTGIHFSGITPAKKAYIAYDDSSITAYNSGATVLKKLRVKTQATTGLGKNANGLYINYDDTTIAAVGSKLRVKYSGIDSNRIKAKNVTWSKIEDLARGHILVGSSSNRPSEYDCRTADYFLVGNGTDVISAGLDFTGDISDVVVGFPTTTITIENDAVTPAKANSDLRRETLIIPMSFDSLADGAFTVYMNSAMEIVYAEIVVTSELSGTDDADWIIIDGTGGTVASGTIPMSSTVGTVVPIVCAANSTTAGQSITIYQSKPTDAGRAILTLVIEKQ